MGTLFVEKVFFFQVIQQLREHYGEPLREIGSLDLSYTL